MILYSNTAYYCSRHLFLHPCILLTSSIRSPEQKGKLRHKQDEASPRTWGPCCDSDWFSANSYRLFSLLLMPPLSPILTYTQLKQPYWCDIHMYHVRVPMYTERPCYTHTQAHTHTLTHASTMGLYLTKWLGSDETLLHCSPNLLMHSNKTFIVKFLNTEIYTYIYKQALFLSW